MVLLLLLLVLLLLPRPTAAAVGAADAESFFLRVELQPKLALQVCCLQYTRHVCSPRTDGPKASFMAGGGGCGTSKLSQRCGRQAPLSYSVFLWAKGGRLPDYTLTPPQLPLSFLSKEVTAFGWLSKLPEELFRP